jgi:hypothetical protein
LRRLIVGREVAGNLNHQPAGPSEPEATREEIMARINGLLTEADWRAAMTRKLALAAESRILAEAGPLRGAFAECLEKPPTAPLACTCPCHSDLNPVPCPSRLRSVVCCQGPCRYCGKFFASGLVRHSAECEQKIDPWLEEGVD